MRLRKILAVHHLLIALLAMAGLGIPTLCGAAPKSYFECDGYLPTGAMPLRVYGVPVGSERTFTIKIPNDYSARNTALAVLWLLVDDIDEPRETKIFVNGKGPFDPPPSCLGEGAGPDRLGREGFMKIDPKSLKPGDNELKFVFADNLGGSTGGFDILRALVVVVPHVKATANLPMIEREVYIEVPDFGTLAVYDRSLTPTRIRRAFDEDPPGWKDHAVRKSDGSGGWSYHPGKFRFLHAAYGKQVMAFGLARMDNDEIILIGNWNDGHNRIILSFTKDNGDTWTNWHTVRIGHGRPMMLLALGNGKVTMAGGRRYFSSDYGRTWPWDERILKTPPLSDGSHLGQEGNALADRDAKGNVTRIAETGHSSASIGKDYPLSATVGYIRWSHDGGRTWTDESSPKEWQWQDTYQGKTYTRGVSEGSLVRAKNGWIVAALRTDMPAKFFKTHNDNFEGIGVSISKDDGKTWSPIKVIFKAGRMHPHLLLIPDGRIIMGYIVRQDIGDDLNYASYRRGCEAVISRDNGLTWDVAGKYVLDDAQWTDGAGAGIQGLACGHTCSTLLENGVILTAYGHYRSKGFAVIRWKP